MALDAKRDEDAGICIQRCQEEVDNLVADVISKLALVRLFLLGYEVVYSASKSVHNSALLFCLAFECIELATDGL